MARKDFFFFSCFFFFMIVEPRGDRISDQNRHICLFTAIN